MLPEWFGSVVVIVALVAAVFVFLECLRRAIIAKAERESDQVEVLDMKNDFIDVGPDPSEMDTVLTSYDPTTDEDIAPIEDDE